MSIVRSKKWPEVGSPRNQSDLRAAAGFLPRESADRVGGGTDGTGEQLRVARLDGVVIGACRIAPEVMRLGESRLKIGVIRELTVHPQFVPHSVRDALLQDALAFLRERRYHLGLTVGPELILHRFGFVPLFRSMARCVAPRSVCGSAGLPIRRAKHGDIPAIGRLYAGAYENTAGSLVRSRAHLARIWTGYRDTSVVTDGAGKTVGYFVARQQAACVDIGEFAFDGSIRPVDFVESVSRFAWESESTRAILRGPEAQLESLGSAPFPGESEALAPVVYTTALDVDELLQSMIPEWENRILCSDLRQLEIEMTLSIGNDLYRIRSRRGAVLVDGERGSNRIALTSVDLIQSILGAAPPDGILSRERRLVTSEAAGFFRALFPYRAPYLSPLDVT